MKYLVFRVARESESVTLAFNVISCIFIPPDNYDDKSYLISRRLNSCFTVARAFRLHAPDVSRGVNRYVIVLRRGKEPWEVSRSAWMLHYWGDATTRWARRHGRKTHINVCMSCMRLTMHRWVKPDDDKDDKDIEDVAAFPRVYVARPIPIALVYQADTWVLCV